MKRVRVKEDPDNNCLFRAVARQVYSNPEDHQRVRDEITNFMRANTDDFIPDVDMTLEEYIQKMEDEGCWGGQNELVAASSRYSRDIVFYEGNHRTQNRHKCVSFNKGPIKGSPIGLLYDNFHYDSMLLIEEPLDVVRYKLVDITDAVTLGLVSLTDVHELPSYVPQLKRGTTVEEEQLGILISLCEDKFSLKEMRMALRETGYEDVEKALEYLNTLKSEDYIKLKTKLELTDKNLVELWEAERFEEHKDLSVKQNELGIHLRNLLFGEAGADKDGKHESPTKKQKLDRKEMALNAVIPEIRHKVLKRTLGLMIADCNYMGYDPALLVATLRKIVNKLRLENKKTRQLNIKNGRLQSKLLRFNGSFGFLYSLGFAMDKTKMILQWTPWKGEDVEDVINAANRVLPPFDGAQSTNVSGEPDEPQPIKLLQVYNKAIDAHVYVVPIQALALGFISVEQALDRKLISKEQLQDLGYLPHDARPKLHDKPQSNAEMDAKDSSSDHNGEPRKFAVGDIVKATWPLNNKRYTATVINVNSDGTYEVRYHSDSKTTSLTKECMDKFDYGSPRLRKKQYPDATPVLRRSTSELDTMKVLIMSMDSDISEERIENALSNTFCVSVEAALMWLRQHPEGDESLA